MKRQKNVRKAESQRAKRMAAKKRCGPCRRRTKDGGGWEEGDDEDDFNPKIEACLREMGENLKFASYLVNGVIAARDEGKVVDLIPALTAIANVSKDARTWRIARTKACDQFT